MRELQPSTPEPPLEGLAENRGRVWESRQQVREETAEQYDDVDRSREDIPVRRTDGGFEPAPAFVEWAAPREAAAEFERQHSDVPGGFGPEDVVARGGGFGLTEPAQKRVAASDLDPQYPRVDINAEDVQREDGGFGLAPAAEREVWAAAYEAETPLGDVNPQSDLKQENGEYELTNDALERAYEQNPSFF